MSNFIYDGGFDLATVAGDPVFSAPLPHTAENFVLTQEFMQFEETFAALALNTPHDEYSDFVLVSEGEKQQVGGGVVKWARTYAKKPDEWSEISGNYSYNFIGFYGAFGINAVTVTGRPRTTLVVPMKITRAYFLTGPGGDYATSEDIPQVAAQTYHLDGDENMLLDYLADSPPFTTASEPSRTEYEAMITAVADIVVEASSVARWMGNFFCRETRSVTAR